MPQLGTITSRYDEQVIETTGTGADDLGWASRHEAELTSRLFSVPPRNVPLNSIYTEYNSTAGLQQIETNYFSGTVIDWERLHIRSYRSRTAARMPV